MAYRVVEIQPTPNPNAAKFILDGRISEQPVSFFNAAAAKDHPIASQLFSLNGVTSLLLLGDFLTVNKSPSVKWADLTKKVEQVLGKV